MAFVFKLDLQLKDLQLDLPGLFVIKNALIGFAHAGALDLAKVLRAIVAVIPWSEVGQVALNVAIRTASAGSC